MAAILTPFIGGQTTKIGKHLFKKRVLPIGEIEYEGKTVRFDPPFLRSLIASFNNQAFDQVPFQLATADNKHNNLPERTAGEVAALELADDGLYVTVSTTDEGAKILSENPKLGISARVINAYRRSDKQFFPAAVQHVLGTLDPKIPGLGPWQAIEASNDWESQQVIDLTGLEFREDEDVADQLSDDELARLRTILASADLPTPQGTPPAAPPTPPAPQSSTGDPGDEDDEGDELTEEELDDLIAAAEALDAEEIAASNDPAAMQALQLVRAQTDQQAIELARVTQQLDGQRWEAERNMFVQSYGIPPAILDLAQPVLEGENHVLELSNGEVVDAGAVMRRVLTEFGQQIKLLDLSGEIGTGFAPEPDAQESAERDALVAAFRANTGI